MTEAEMRELDEVLNLWRDAFNRKAPVSTECEHEPKEYIGFTEKYDFCLKCDAKFIDGTWRLKTSTGGVG